MLWTSFPAETEPAVRAVAAEMPGLQIISYRHFSLPVHRYDVRFRVSEGVKPNMIEEMVMDALSAGFTFPVTCEFIASALGLDSVFIENAVKKLEKLRVIETDEKGAVRLTARGRIYAENNMLPGRERENTISFYYDKKFGGTYISAEATAPVYDKFEQIDEEIADRTKFISPTLLAEVAEKQGAVIENRKEGEIISGFVSSEITGSGFTEFTEIWVYDYVNQKAFCRVWDCANDKFAEELTQFAEKHTYLNEITNPEKYTQIKSGNYDRETVYSELARKALATARFENANPGENLPVRIAEVDSEINLPPCDNMIIITPWLYFEVIDEKFMKLAEKTGHILLGYGNGIVPDPRCVEKLLSITDELGIPKIFPCFMEDLKEKEFLAEGMLHCVGSVDYSENADDYFKREESVYMAYDKECIAVAETRLKKLFLDNFENQSVINERFSIAALGAMSRLMSEDGFEEYVFNAVSEAKGVSLYNILQFMKRKNLITEESFRDKMLLFPEFDGKNFIF